MNLSGMRTKSCDVVVCGGGTAGVFAGISAAKSGAKVILIEKNNILGGTITSACVNFPGLFFAWGKQIISGPGWESIQRTIKLGGAVMPEISFRPQRHWMEQIKLNPFVYTAVLFEMCSENGIELITNAMPSYITEHEEGVELLVTDKSGLFVINAKKLIDTTGDANVVKMAGYSVEKSKIQQPATLQNRIGGYNMAEVDIAALKEGFEKENFPSHISAEMLAGFLQGRKIDLHILCRNADTSEGRTLLEMNTYSLLMKIYKYFRTIKGLENFTFEFTALETGVRESNRIVGESIVTAEDYIEGKAYPDSVCYAFYPIDQHRAVGIKQQFHKENTVGQVPYGALIPHNSKHTLVAGRCISSDTLANSALRVQAVCMATGQAAGCGAAIAAQKNIGVYRVEFGELKAALKKIGAIIPCSENKLF